MSGALFESDGTDTTVAYDETYARSYSERWWDQDLWQADANWFERLISERLGPGTRWLDVGCGTGHFLSRFPEAERAGVDLSGDMLAVARESNPGIELRQADATEPHPTWDGQWDLVTCTGEPWSYLTSLASFERWVACMAAWTSPGGVCLNQTPDATELAGASLDYRFTDDAPPPGIHTVLGVIWDMAEDDMIHGQMIWPSIDQWARWYGRHFSRVEVLHPPADSGVIFGRTILASGKRDPGDGRPTTYIYEPPPQAGSGASHSELAGQLEELRADLATMNHQIANLADLIHRPSAPEAGDAGRYDIIGVIHDQVGGIRRELAQLSDRIGSPGRSTVGRIRRVASKGVHKLRK